ncbi:MAG: adenylosuccinate lyase [Spirochaetales bacterium]|nr:adenylosuccinate lyase [Candidatus Physcosoma equi]
MDITFDHSTYISPYTWRYGSEEMKEIFSEVHKRKLLRRVWIALAKAECKAGIVTEAQVKELEEHKDEINIQRATEIENMIRHDLMAEIKTYAEQCPTAGGIIHLGATSMDALDNADAVRFKEAMALTLSRLDDLIDAMVEKAETYKATATMAFTHIQPAEITTIGYRLSQTIQDLLDDREELRAVAASIRGKGMKGAVGTGASYKDLCNGTSITSLELEKMVMEELGIKAFTAATQIYTRKQDVRIIAALSNIACTLHKFSQDFRILQSPPIGEFSEPFGKMQVGSSAMPFKRNPINSEKIDSLCRLVESQYQTAWNNAATTVLERSLDDSANRRVFIPESFIALDEILITELKIVKGMSVHSAATKRLLDSYGIFASTERLLMELGKKGADRQAMHETIREESLKAWALVQEGQANPLKESILKNPEFLKYLSKEEMEECLSAEGYVGDAIVRTEMIVEQAKNRK